MTEQIPPLVMFVIILVIALSVSLTINDEDY